MFKRAIVRKPSSNIAEGITNAKLGKVDYGNAIRQHQNYIKTLEACGVEVIDLPAAEAYPDAVFIEDTAILTPKCAVITRPGADSRTGETKGLEKILKSYYQHIEQIKSPGTLEGGDVMCVDQHYYIGLSKRTNKAGAEQLIAILNRYGMTGSTVSMNKMLHLKTGVSYLENDTMLVGGEFIHKPDFAPFNCIEIPENEVYASNSIWVNGTVIVPADYPITKKRIEEAGYSTLETDVSEFRKLDGGLSCLSLRF